MDDIERIGVVGCGLMGSGIAEVCARAGRHVVVLESSQAAAEAGLRRISRSLARATAAGKLSPKDRDAALARIETTTDMNRMADRDLVVEAVAENEAAKVDVFARLDATVKRRTRSWRPTRPRSPSSASPRPPADPSR